ncbi:hypothetical protein [Pyruvatibacter sp.]|uniref:hypothetical protein n=1 Tax=Pyruvatibacter sp. TaxID=1981328 RepID=UPI0032F05804
MISDRITASVNRMVDANIDGNLLERDFQAEMRELRKIARDVRALETQAMAGPNVVPFTSRTSRDDTPYSPWTPGGAA